MVKKHMPSPVGHALAGIAAAWAADLLPGRRLWPIAVPPAPVFMALPGTGGTVTLCAAALGTAGVTDVQTGSFGAEMAVELVNDGPFTIWLATD